MSFSKAISELESAMEATRAELGEIVEKIATLSNDRDRVAKRPPHTDDIVAVYMRGLANSERDFEQQFGSQLNRDFVAAPNAADACDAAKGTARDILRVEGRKLSDAERQDRAMKREEAALNSSALAYFLRDQIALELPALIDKLCPAARGGIKAAERSVALAALDAEIATLGRKRDELQAELANARQVILR